MELFVSSCGEYRLKRFVNPCYDVNSYWLTLNKSNISINLLIDCGSDNLNDVIPEDVKFDAVLLTHGHHDHILGLTDFLQNRSDIPVIASTHCIDCLNSPKLNLSYYTGTAFKVTVQNIIDVKDFRNLKALRFNESLSYLNTPGHNIGSVSYFIGPFMFTGDSWIPGNKIVTSLPYGDRKASLQALKLLQSLTCEYPIICPGHGALVDLRLGS